VEKIWLQNYEPEVPHTIDADAYQSVAQFAEECFSKYSDKPCYLNMGSCLTYHELEKQTRCFAGFLQHHCRMQTGDRIAIMMPNVLQFPVAMYGSLRAGLTVVNVNPLYTARELHHLLMDSGAQCIVVLANFAHVLEKALPDTQVKHVIVTEIGDLMGWLKGKMVNFVVKHIKKMVPPWHIKQAIPFSQAVQKSHSQHFKKPTLTPSDVAFLQYTGGTTGGAKGAMLTHRNIIANVTQATAWISPFFKVPPKGGIITALPLYHIFSLMANCLTFLNMGIPNILITNPRDIAGFVKELKRQPFSVMTGVNTLFNALLHNKDFCAMDFRDFKFTLGGGMAVQAVVAKRWQEVTGVPLLQAYGLTETSPAVTINPLNLKQFNGSIGLPISSTEIKICDDQGSELPLGEKGELCVKGPQVMKGYWQQAEQTQEVLSKDGWLKTGDIAYVDEQGFVYLVDRKKDIIIVSGFNVYPNEVEEVIATMKGVLEVAVIGVKSEEHGEVVKAFIVRSDPTLTTDEVVQYCREQLTNYKIPKEIEFKDELPKTNVGKVLRRALRE